LRVPGDGRGETVRLRFGLSFPAAGPMREETIRLRGGFPEPGERSMSAGTDTKLDELQRRLAYNERLREVADRIHAAEDLDRILVDLQPEILELFDADRITVYAVDPARNEIFSRFMVGAELREIRVPIEPTSIAGYSASQRRPINVFDVYKAESLKKIDPKLRFDESWDRRTGYRSKQMLAVPILYRDELLGVVQLINKKNGNFFTREDEKSLREVARTLGVAFHNQRKMVRTPWEHLVRNGVIGERDLVNAVETARKQKRPVETVLMESFKIKKKEIGAALSAYYGCPFLEYNPAVIVDRSLLGGLNPGYLRKAGWLPIEREDGVVSVLIDDPRDMTKVMEVRSLVPASEYRMIVALRDDIVRFLDSAGETAGEGGGSIREILAEMDIQELPGEGEEAKDEESGVDENASTIVRLVNQIIIDGCREGASDIHVEPSKRLGKTFVRFRVDGVCVRHLEIPYTYSRAISSRIKIMAHLDIAERRLPQDGKIKFLHAGREVELRVATLPTVSGEDVVMRILAANEPMPLDGLNLSKRNFEVLKSIITKPYGIILVVGPTGSGKTTTLHAAVGYINTPERKIWTAEDPVEITQEGLRQVEVKPKIDFTFARAMRAFLRADPDVIMVGEMRDYETASIGVEASLTGHLVFSTLHTNSAPETVTRLIDMGIDPFNFADAMLGILAQRLVRTLCRECREAYRPEAAEIEELAAAYGPGFEELGVDPGKLTLYRPRGCGACNNTGYRGRTGLHELLLGTDAMKAIIQRKGRVEEIREQAVADGMRTLYQDGIAKVLRGLTDIKMVRAVCIK